MTQPESHMIMFDSEKRRFMFRVSGVAVIAGQVLVHQFEGADDFFVLPGGRVEWGEAASEALARELREELGCEAEVGRLLWVLDNFFTHKGLDYHELGLVFEYTLPEGSMQASGQPWTGDEVDGTKLYFQWKPISELPEIDLKPSVLRELLQSIPAKTEYVTHRDDA